MLVLDSSTGGVMTVVDVPWYGSADERASSSRFASAGGGKLVSFCGAWSDSEPSDYRWPDNGATHAWHGACNFIRY